MNHNKKNGSTIGYVGWIWLTLKNIHNSIAEDVLQKGGWWHWWILGQHIKVGMECSMAWLINI